MNEKTTRRRRSAPTIRDVARLANVSSMTVSRVINGEANVRQTTREAVNAAISALSYSPNSAARSLAGAGQDRIGLLYSNPSAAYLSEFLVGSLDQASRSDVQLIIEKCDLGDHEVEVAKHLIESGIGGLILPSPLCDSAKLIETIAAEGVPAVLVGSGRPDKSLFAVSIDEFAAAYSMTRHIVSLGNPPNANRLSRPILGGQFQHGDAGVFRLGRDSHGCSRPRFLNYTKVCEQCLV